MRASALARVPRVRGRKLFSGMVVGLALAVVALPAGADAKSSRVRVMTRNLYLGADLTPGVQATNLQGLVDAPGRS